MSELREECYKCLNNQICPSCADYGSIICMTKRKYEMPKNREDSVYAIRFSAMQQQINEKDARIKELEEENRIYVLEGNRVKLELYIKENYIPVQKVKNKIEEAKHNKKVGNMAYEYTEEDIWDIVKDELEGLLEDK
mgnify:CR=1 FL=1